MPIVHVHVGKYGIKDVLLNGGSSVNIISKKLSTKLRLRKLQLAPFVVHMVDQRKVQLIWLVRNLKIDLVGCEYKIRIIILNMDNGIETYSMLFGRPCLKHVKAHHSWGVTTLTITLGETNVPLSNIKWMNIKPFGLKTKKFGWWI